MAGPAGERILSEKVELLLKKAKTESLTERELEDIEVAYQELLTKKRALTEEIATAHSKSNKIKNNEIVHLQSYRIVLQALLKEIVKDSNA